MKRQRLTVVTLIVLLCTVIAMGAIFPRQLQQVAEMPTVDSVHILASVFGLAVPPRYPVTLIKVDNRTHEAWGRPFPMAKARLADVVSVLRELGPTAILIDFDLSIARDSADTAAFSNLLSSWTEDDPPLLLPAELGVLPDGSVTRADSVFAVPQAGPTIFWTSVLFRKDSEFKVREWRLWETICATGEILLSPQLIVSALRQGGADEVRGVTGAIAQNSSCADAKDTQQGALPSWLVDAAVLSPINYVFGRTSQPYHDAAGSPMLMEWSAIDVLDKGIASSAVSGRTVIIGASRVDSGDNHATPIGQMEGMRVLANAIATGPDVFGFRNPSIAEALLMSLLFAVGGIAAIKRLKLAISGIAVLAAAVFFYAIVSRMYGPAGAIGALSWGLTLTGVFFVLESLILFFKHLLYDRRGWRSLLNKE